MKASIRSFGPCSDGEAVLISLTDSAGNTVCLSSLGAAIQSVIVKDKNGIPTDVVLGFDSAAEYERSNSCFGGTMGRNIGRIDGASFTLGGRTYHLSENRPGYHMHGGFKGFHKRLWEYELLSDGVAFSLQSPDGDEGYPGRLDARVIYRWADEGVLSMEYDCRSDAETVINLTNHSYFNLSGHASSGALEQSLRIFSDLCALTDDRGMFAGALGAVEGTPMDFRTAHAVGERIDSDFSPVLRNGGYDQSFIINGDGMRRAAVLKSDKTGIEMTVSTSLPALGLYTANGLAPHEGKGGAHYGVHDGVCLEVQFVQNSVNAPGYSPKPIFGPGKPYSFTTTFSFTTEA